MHALLVGAELAFAGCGPEISDLCLSDDDCLNGQYCDLKTEMCEGIEGESESEFDGQVSARFPWNGYTTGSVWATEVSLTVDSRRPKFIWNTVELATSYELQIDDSCTTSDFGACNFPSPELDSVTTATTVTLDSDLPVSETPPVGTRYYWRVRACRNESCGVWAAARYLDVGRLNDDLNGDGFSDVIVAAHLYDNDASNEGNVFVYHGSESGVPAMFDLMLDNPDDQELALFGYSVASVGDVNSDGFADVVVGAPALDHDASDEGNAFVYYGSASGVSKVYDVRVENPDNQIEGVFGHSVASAGDINGDGFADVIVSAPLQDVPAADDGSAFLYLGSDSGVSPSYTVRFDQPDSAKTTNFGTCVASAGDVNGDGFADVIVGAAQFAEGGTDPGTDSGTAFAYFGSGSGISETYSVRLDDPGNQTNAGFGVFVASADLNGDGFSDVIVGADLQDYGASDEGNAFVYYGSDSGLPDVFDIRLDNPDNQEVGSFGHAAASAGDVNGDGFMDLIIGARYQENGASAEGNAFVYYGSVSGVSETNDVRLDNPDNQVDGRFGVSVSSAGDVNGDGFAELIVGAERQDHGAVTEGNAFIYFGSDLGVVDDFDVRLDNPENQEGAFFGHRVE